MNTTRKALIPLVFCLGWASAAVAQDEQKKSVIFLIGDGMGASQVTLGRLGAAALDRPYALDRFKVVGFASTGSADNTVTDSAAAATALACGVKTKNKTIGMNADYESVETILEVAHGQSYATGLVTTTRITHATPACFAAHVKTRYQEADVAAQMVAKGYPEVLIGGGRRNFKKEHFATLKENGYVVATNPAELAAASGAGKLVGLISKSHVAYQVDGGERTALVDMAKHAEAALSGKAPYFLMIEGGRIDHACHAHDAVGMLGEQLEFDAVVGWALDLAKADPNILVVVTADHATGSLGISERIDVAGLLKASASTEALTKIHKTPEALGAAVKETHGFELSAEELATVFKHPKDKYWTRTALGHLLSERYGVSFYDLDWQQEKLTITHGHDGAMVPVYAYGPGADAFAGTYENTEIPKKIVAILGLSASGALASARKPSYFK